MKKSLIILALLVCIKPIVADAKSLSHNATNQQDTIAIKGVVLHPENGNNSDCLAATLVEIDGHVMVLFQNTLYAITRLQKNSAYDSEVIINSVSYIFRIKARPYE